jgi:hypothetical protein
MKTNILAGVATGVMVMASFPAAAEWVKVAQTGTATFYVDNAAIARVGTQVKVWQLTDLKQTNSAPATTADHLSSIGQSEYDCALHKYRNGYLAQYAGPMGSGLPGRSIIGSRAWAPITTDSVEEKISAFACSRP